MNATTELSAKDVALEIVSGMPSDATIADIIDAIYVRQKIEMGLREIDNGEGVPHGEARSRFAQWLT